MLGYNKSSHEDGIDAVFGGILPILVFFILWAASLNGFAQQDPFSIVKVLVQTQQYHQALQAIDKINDQTLSKRDQSLKYMARGVLQHELGKESEAIEDFKKSSQFGGDFENHLNYQMALSFKQLRNYEKAKEYFDKIPEKLVPRNIQLDLKYNLSEIYVNEKNWSAAYRNLKYLERSFRGEQKHAIVLWRLLIVELNRKRHWQACRWARKLYSQHPQHSIVYDWDVELQKNKVDGKALDCVASQSDIASRMKRLNWSGESRRADKELEQLKKVFADKDPYTIDSLIAQNLVNGGYSLEALRKLLQYYETESSNYDYLLLMAKAAARAGEYQTAVGAYYKAYETQKRRSKGRSALFKAAFLSYQFQDYDGASRKFEELIRTNPNSGLVRDSEWYLAWIQYLKRDYQGAADSFKKILFMKKKKRRLWRNYSTEKVKYWLAMSYFRLKKYHLARPLFDELASNGLRGFYAYAALERKRALPQEKLEFQRGVASIGDESEEAEVLHVDELESEESLAEKEEQEVEVGVDEPEDFEEEETFKFKDPRFAEYFARAKDFVRLGFFERARWEYYSIERHTSNKDYLRVLIKAYNEIGAYHRSAYLGEVYFGTQRKRNGFEKARELWQATFPRAYSEFVVKSAENFSVPDSFVWGIIRAESRYRPEVMSPVGAQGLMQIMPNTGLQVSRLLGDRTFNVKSLSDPQANIRLGTRYLHRLLKKFNDKIPLAAAGYNAGPHRVENWLSNFGSLEMDEFIEHIPFVETRNYVKKVVHFYGIYSELHERKAPQMNWLTAAVPVTGSKEGKAVQRENWDPL